MAISSTDRPAIYYSPHADDEVLSLGVSIANHVAAGRKVLVVLMTSGCSQWVEDMLNGRVTCALHGGAHHPVHEDYYDTDLTREEIGRAREEEFSSSVGAFRRQSGGNVEVRFEAVPDGALTVARAKGIIASYAARFPNSSHKTMTWTDTASDHAACGQALRELRAEGALSDARFYIMPERAAAASSVGPWREDLASSGLRPVLDRAASPYRAWNPSAGALAVGMHSVPESFARVARDPYALVHS